MGDLGYGDWEKKMKVGLRVERNIGRPFPVTTTHHNSDRTPMAKEKYRTFPQRVICRPFHPPRQFDRDGDFELAEEF